MGNTHALLCFFRAALPLGVVLSTSPAISGNNDKTDNKEDGENKNNDNDNNNVLAKKKRARCTQHPDYLNNTLRTGKKKTDATTKTRTKQQQQHQQQRLLVL